MSDKITIENVCFSYKAGYEVLSGVSTEFSSGGIHCLFGPNGSGKTTLLRCLAGLLKPESGTISLLGNKLNAMTAREISRTVAYVPQEHSISFPFTVFEMALMGRNPYLGAIGSGPSEADKLIVKEALKSVGIEALADKAFTELSGGQKQMTMIARALAQDTPVIILDEPTSALDFKNQISTWKMLKMLRDRGKTIIVCTHDPNHVLWFSDSVTILKEGTIVAEGSPKTLITDELLTMLYGDICKVSDGFVRPNEAKQS